MPSGKALRSQLLLDFRIVVCCVAKLKVMFFLVTGERKIRNRKKY